MLKFRDASGKVVMEVADDGEVNIIGGTIKETKEALEKGEAKDDNRTGEK